MSELKTAQNDGDVEAFIASVEDETKRRDCRTLVDLMSKVTGSPPSMWGTAIIGFGSYRYRYASGRENDWFKVGFSPRKQSLTLYIMDGFDEYESVLERLGKHSTGKSCLYVKRLSEIDMDVLTELVERSVRHMGQADAAGT
jgi:hypothetical protein